MNDFSYKYIYATLFIIIAIVIIDDINLSNRFYENVNLVSNPDSFLTLVNKNNQLSPNYIPIDLELLKNDDDKIIFLRKIVKDQYIKLKNMAKQDGIYINVVSAYRNYDYQANLFNYYVQNKGLSYAKVVSARAGHSELQTGLAIDIEGENKDYDLFHNSSSYLWMIKNAYKYGFILRYPEGKENITGYNFEPWHYRYVGLVEAKTIYDNNLTLEEYYINYW
ncbi:MAG: M15 family metallopeptidase [Bacilli bacterium]|nr:M15 family metallopeptidase [Bacilli bacterium]